MKTTARILTGWIAVAMSFWVGSVAWASPQSGAAAWAALASVGQMDGSADRQQKADDLLRRAREAMAQNDMKAAETLVSQAEALNVQYPPIYLADTPKKARRDLERIRTAGKSPTLPSQMFSPLSNSKKAPAVDPFAARSAAGARDAGTVTPLPPTGMPSLSQTPTPTPYAPSSSMSPPSGEDTQLPPALARGYMPASASAAPAQDSGDAQRSQSDSLLHGARCALAVGDVRRASEMVRQAKQLQARYAPLDDSPEKVEAAISKYQEVATLDKSTEIYRRAYARMLMEQAEVLLRWSEYAQAEELATQASRQQVVYGPFEAKPEDLLKRISAVKQQGRAAIGAVASSADRAVNSLDRTANSLADRAAASLDRAASSVDRAANSVADSAAGVSATAKQRSAELLGLARQALRAGQLDRAEFLTRQVEQLRIPEAAYAPGEDRPGFIMLDIRQARTRSSSAVMPAAGTSDMGGAPAAAVYDDSRDITRNQTVSNQQPLVQPQEAEMIPAPAGRPVSATEPATSQAQSLFQQGETALKAHDRDRAYDLFRQAAARMNELDPVTAQRLQDHLQLLSAPRNQPGQAPQAGSPVDEATAKQQALIRKIVSDTGHIEANARAMREKDPKAALAMLEQHRKQVEGAGLEPGARDQMLRRIDRSLAELRGYIEQNRPLIDMTEKNNQTRQDLDREAQVKQQNQEKLAKLVNEYNQLMQEQRYPEAEVIVKRATEIMPNELVVQVMTREVKLRRNLDNALATRDKKENGFAVQMGLVDDASTPPQDDNPIHFPDARKWAEYTKVRGMKAALEKSRRRNEREMEIEKKLRTPILVSFQNKPLSQVLDQLGKLADINIHLDEEGLRQEGLSPDTPVTLELSHEIMLKSYLNLLLDARHLCYIIKDEVLKVTSEQMRAGQIYTVTYAVGDLVMPIPNFVASPRMGLAGAYHDALGNIGFGANGPFGTSQTPLAVVASKDGRQNNAAINPSVLAQVPSRVGGAGGGATSNMPMGFGPGGLGGGNAADFDSIINLITQTVVPKSWQDAGGQGTIAQFETNLSLVVSQTQEVHEEIVDLLEQLRRMQDLQVTIEVRFITLNDNFFERIGVDFDFNINKNNSSPEGAGFSAVTSQNVGGVTVDTRNRLVNNGTAVVGLQNVGSNPAQNGVYTADLDIPFRQGSYGLAVPQFGGFDAAAGASLGFAILSDIEAFFFINAAQGDKRTNVLQAPKVTLFNGQQAFVSDTSQTPFVISVVPVVGDFAAAQQPVIVVLSEGTFMTVQAVVSNDRRFVRLTIVPFFSKIGKDVNTFTFQGSETTTTDTTREGLIDQTKDLFDKNTNNNTTTKSGVTVQLPTFSFVTVTTTVSVPDGGTVLLGGIKRLSEGRSEYGVPILDKVPYLNRLFKNVGIGRETSSLMMMVTPRIIIQEEEEAKLGVTPP